MNINKYLLDQIKTYESLMKDLEEEQEQKKLTQINQKNNINKNQIVFYWTKLMQISKIKKD